MARKRAYLIAFAVFDILLMVIFVGLFLARQDRAANEQLAELGAGVFEQAFPVSDFQLTDQHGNQFTRADLSGKWNLVFFGFTSCPDICPLTMQALSAFYRDLEAIELQADTDVIMVTVDPLRDTPDVMADYVESFHPDFKGLTGEYPAIAGLASELFIAFSSPTEHGVSHADEDYEVQHSDYIAVIDPAGQYRSVLHSPHRRERLMQAYLAIRDEAN